MDKVCCIKGCDKKVEAMGLCVNHYRMNKKYGSPVAARPLSAIVRGMSTEERFWFHVEKTDGCWGWKASKTRDGYAKFRSNAGDVKWQTAHRYSWYLHTGEILSQDVLIMHLCDNRSCTNPNHLKPGTTIENSADMVSKGRQCGGEQHARKQAKLTEDQVRKIAADPRKYEDIAKDYDCQRQCVFDIKNRKTWWFLTDLVIAKNKRGSAGENRSKNLTDDDVRAIRASTEKGSALAKQYNVSHATICDIQKRRSWKHVN